jgi:predicted RNase H-like HicB family nuclease
MTYRFAAVISREDEFYVARCPELGVTSQGKDVESACANLREAIELYLETWGLPEGYLANQQPLLTEIVLPARVKKRA